MTHYEMLKVPSSATIGEIRRAYRRAALRFHPDRNPDDKDAEGRFKEISAAYTVLSDPKKRRQYDLKIRPPLVSASPHRGGTAGPGFVFRGGTTPVHWGFSPTAPMPTNGTFPGNIQVVVNGVRMPGFRTFTTGTNGGAL